MFARLFASEKIEKVSYHLYLPDTKQN